MLNIFDEEEKRKQGMGGVGAPLAVNAYSPVQEATPVQRGPAEQPGVVEQLAKTYVSGKAVQGLDKGVGYAGDQAKSIWNSMQPKPDVDPSALAGDYTNQMDMASDAFKAPLAEAPVQLGEAGGEAIAGEVAQTGLLDASTAGAADATAGATASTAGPLAGVVEYARTGDVKKGAGAGVGAAAGAVAGNAILPGVGGYIGSMIGAQLGSSVGGK